MRSTNLGIRIPNRNVAREMLMKTVVFGRRGLLPMVMSWNKDEQNMGAMPMTGHSRFEIRPQGRSRAKAGIKAKIDMRRSWRWGSLDGGAYGWFMAMAVERSWRREREPY